MRRLTRFQKLFTLAWSLSFFVFVKPLTADDELVHAGKELVNKTNETAKSMINTFLSAMKGEPGKMNELLTVYVAPAAVALLALFIGYIVASFIGRVVGGLFTRKVDVTLGKFMSKMIRHILMILVMLVTLSTFGVDVTSFAAILAAAGFAVGMSLQGTLSSFAAGVMLLVFRPFKVDDYIKAAGTEGIVEEIDLFSTRLNSLDHRHLIIPNGQIFGALVENYSRNGVRRVDVNVSAEYRADLKATRYALEEAVCRVSNQSSSHPPQVYLVELGESSVNWQCRVWCRPQDYWTIREKLTEAAKNAMDRHGIGIPFPQLDVNVVGKVLAKAA